MYAIAGELVSQMTELKNKHISEESLTANISVARGTLTAQGQIIDGPDPGEDWSSTWSWNYLCHL